MYFAKALFVCASLVASAVSQSTGAHIAFTVLPPSMIAGQDITLHWGGGDGSNVTLTLQQGTTNNLQTVQLVTGSATGGQYTWLVPKSLPNADNYAFRIQQGDTEPNYTGMIALSGGSTSSASASSSSASASASTTKGSSGGVVGGGSSGDKSSSASHNSTVVATATANATTTVMAGTAASASGTGVSMARNTTMSKASLSATSTGASSTSSNPSIGGSGGTPTGSTTAPSATKTGGAVALVASNFALLVCAVAGVVYLG